jgi:chemotaxis protein methyltransferase CheR
MAIEGRSLRGGISAGQPLALPDSVYALLRDLVVERTGVLFDERKRSLFADKLSELVIEHGLASFLDYYYMLRYDDEGGAHWRELMDRMAVPETYFWRQIEQIVALAGTIAPAYFAAHRDRPLRIWSAGCCSGEEPLSIAIALHEAGILGRVPVEIVGTDGSQAMIERARAGLYGERSFRQLPDRLKQKYFEPVGSKWRPIEAIRGAVQWDVANLVKPDEIRSVAAADVIFCRNVFIYFSDEAIRSVVESFIEFMPNDAYLFLGAAESLTRFGVALELSEIGGAFVYLKKAHQRMQWPD